MSVYLDMYMYVKSYMKSSHITEKNIYDGRNVAIIFQRVEIIIKLRLKKMKDNSRPTYRISRTTDLKILEMQMFKVIFIILI